MREIKFEIKLKAKEPIRGYKTGETVIIVNPIFDSSIGIAFLPIDKKFDIVYQRQFVGLKDKNGNDIYEGDIIKFKDFVCEVYFDFAGFRIKPVPNLEINNICTHRDFEIIGNIFDNPELLSNK